MKVRRVYLLSTILTGLFAALIYRLGDIQLFSATDFGPNHVNLLERSVKQRAHELPLSSGRGTILDRHGVPLTNEKIYDVILYPYPSEFSLNAEKLAGLLHIPKETLASLFSDIEKPAFLSEYIPAVISEEQYQNIKKMEIPYLLPVVRSFAKDPDYGEHFIGLVRENPELFRERYAEGYQYSQPKPVGISGLQSAFDSFLVSERNEKILFHVDARGTPLFGSNYSFVGSDDYFFPVNIHSTLDLTIQKQAESLLDRYGMDSGGLVLLDVETRDVLAMVSLPEINSENPYEEQSIRNQMLTAHFPGSIFKTVVAAAAIEQIPDIFDRTFNCNRNVYGDGPSSRKLGILNFKDSFAYSCNRAFAQLAIELVKQDENMLEQYAEKLGILGPAGWKGNLFRLKDFRHFPEEQQGNIWGEPWDRHVERAISQTAIGQKEVKATPLAVANMMATIASQGIQKEVRGVKKITYKNGAVMATFDSHLKDERLHPNTAAKLKTLLRSVVEKGTARTLAHLSVAGKTGTAETGHDQREHHWMAGFFPYQEPKYALVVTGLSQKETPPVLQIYQKMVEFLQAKEDLG
ncbi:MAG: penicillin-binding protein 2 [Bacillaceae bacterium]|nr:penicillin-binding protein 2 [Bacillaceae bacterium]